MRIKLSPGDRFGRLTVIQEVERIGNNRRFLCRCNCGTERIVSMKNLRSGHTKSCGCLGRERLSLARVPDDLSNRRFGRLVAREQLQMRRNGSVVWRCECDCGRIANVPARDLVHGNTTSCGCAMVDFTRSLKKHNEQYHTVDGVFVPLLRQKLQHNNKTGVKGVSIQRDKHGRIKYKANITVGGKRIYLGLFPTIDEAAEARRRAEEKYHKPYLEKAKRKGEPND